MEAGSGLAVTLPQPSEDDDGVFRPCLLSAFNLPFALYLVLSLVRISLSEVSVMKTLQRACFFGATFLATRTASSFLVPTRSSSLGALYTSQDDSGEDEMARDFYRELQKREIESKGDENIGEVPRPARKKFTGREARFAGSLFSENTSDTKTPLDREREREFNLAGRFERTLPLQAALVVFSLVVVLAVGLTGGITDGSDRSFDDEIDFMGGNCLEEIRTDVAGSDPSEDGVWL